ncbi:PadR family transcriptional regulator [archaeon]|nr:PadR family transcriptional regulator [archaeon]
MSSPSERFKKSLTNDNLWIYILSLLKKEKLYAYEINEKIEKVFDFYPGNMTAYIILKRLQMDGYVKAARTEKSGGPERKYYMITKKGIDELKKAKKIYARMKNFL